MSRYLLASLFMLTAATAQAQDGGVRDGGDGCGAITFEGECNGNVLSYCDPDTNTVVMVDCVAEVSDTAICMEIDNVYGFDCALAVDEGCIDEDGNIYFCAGAAPGCFEDPTGSVCAENIGPCTMDDVDTCDGDLWTFECSVNQPYIVDCGAYGGRCISRPGGCVDLPVGSFCDATFTCAAGLTCGTLGLCEASTVRDGGVARDGGTTAPRDGGPAPVGVTPKTEDDSGCGCAATSTSNRSSAWWFAALSVFVLRGRRRRTQK